MSVEKPIGKRYTPYMCCLLVRETSEAFRGARFRIIPPFVLYRSIPASAPGDSPAGRWCFLLCGRNQGGGMIAAPVRHPVGTGVPDGPHEGAPVGRKPSPCRGRWFRRNRMRCLFHFSLLERYRVLRTDRIKNSSVTFGDSFPKCPVGIHREAYSSVRQSLLLKGGGPPKVVED